MEKQTFDRLLKEKTEQLEKEIREYLPAEEGLQKTVIEAMNYSLLAGGKRLRPMLMRETFAACGGEGDLVKPFLAAVEMIHTYSLVHDDLPAMDNDEYRRGRKTTWSVYGDAMGILAGDGLLNYAFETALRAFKMCGGDAAAMQRVAAALYTLAEKAGIYGMIGGQTADIEAQGQEEPITEKQLLFIHEHKTAALIEASMTVGAILAGASGKLAARIGECARGVGLAFQIQDDILDVVGNSQELGKAVGSDEQNHKQTYVTMKGLEAAAEDVERYSRAAVEILDELEGEHEFLRELILNLIHRRK